jgi:hypothetical protein
MSSLGLNLVRLLLCAVLVAGAAAGTASATGGESSNPSTGPTLQGENLLAPFAGVTVTSNCNEEGNSSVTYHAEGVATGPFPGTFVADGSITIGPQTLPARPPTGDSGGTFMGPILMLTETFTITSLDTTITGSKTLTQPLAALGERERATCQDVTFFAGVTGTGRVVEIEAATTYVATIQTPLGTFMDSGRSTPTLLVTEITGRCAGGIPCQSRNANFDQLFTLSDQSEPPAPPCDEDDQGDQDQDGDDQGCEDHGDQGGDGQG